MCSKQGSMGWVETNLGSIIELNYGKSLPAKRRDGGEFPVYGSNGIVGSHSKALVTEPGIIVGRKGSYGEVQFSDKPFYPIDTTYYVNQLYRQPLRYWFYQLVFLPLNQLNRSTAIPGLNRDDAYAQEIALPPLAEQKVIADKLDTLLAQVDNTKARLERIPKILKRFRQSVLAAAVSGRLIEEWRSNSGSYIHPDAVDWKWPPIPGNWNVKPYSDLVDSRLGKMLDKAKNRGIPTKYLGNVNVRWFDFNLSEAQEILVSEIERTELTIRPGDVLICEGGEPGRCAIWDGRINEKIVFQKAIHRARVSEFITPEWLTFNLKHDADSLILNQLFTGTTIKHLTGKALKKYPLRIPPIDEQTEIVRRVDQLFAHADRIEQQVDQALVRVKNLTQSILAKAFRGELTEQWRKDNPELISGENSAEALLERIKAERAAKAPAKRTRKKATA
ncbi:restriction endonuclease subunit S [Halomonas sp. NyZ770]|uniref:restriction endonuclease subunit S n=1 Tax=Halomonas sp. NyZ770 TaxID=2883106 RepID=UPI001D0B6DA0|nr:restriction endonuclease subunit S [Halomonas sp. NyZ770]UDM07287.1 restriction endonuclease subunit S [Halomonas sp. NyZ770]